MQIRSRLRQLSLPSRGLSEEELTERGHLEHGTGLPPLEHTYHRGADLPYHPAGALKLTAVIGCGRLDQTVPVRPPETPDRTPRYQLAGARVPLYQKPAELAR